MRRYTIDGRSIYSTFNDMALPAQRKKTFEEWLAEQDISPVSPEAHYAELAWYAAVENSE